MGKSAEGHDLVVDLAELGQWLDSKISKVLSSQNDSKRKMKTSTRAGLPD